MSHSFLKQEAPLEASGKQEKSRKGFVPFQEEERKPKPKAKRVARKKRRSTKLPRPVTKEPPQKSGSSKKLFEKPEIKEASVQENYREHVRSKAEDVKVKELEQKIKKVTGHTPHTLTGDEGKVAVAMFLESPDLKKAAAAEKKELKDAILHPPPSSQARTKKGGTIEEEAHAAQWEMAVAMQAFHANHMKKPEGMPHMAWATKNLATSAGLITVAEDHIHKRFLSPLCRAMLEDSAGESGISDSSFDTLSDDGILAVEDKDVPWPQNRCLFLSMQDSNCSPVFYKKLHEKAQRSSSKKATLSDFMHIVSLNPRAIHAESLALGERLHFCYDVLDVWGELLGPGRLHLGPDGLMGALKSEKAVLDALPGLRTIRNPAHYRASYCGANALPESFDASKEPQHLSSFEAEVLLRGIAAFLYCDLLDRIKRRQAHGHDLVVCETPPGEVEYRGLGKTLLDSFLSGHSHDHNDQAILQSLRYLFGGAACSKLRSWDAHIDGLLSDLEIVRRKLVPWAARYHIRDGITHGFWGAAGWAKDQAERVGSVLRHRVVRKVVRHTVRSVSSAVDKLQMLRWFHYISKKVICIFYLLFTAFSKSDEPKSFKNLATYIFSKQVVETFTSCVGKWDSLTQFKWTELSSYMSLPMKLLTQLGSTAWDLWKQVNDSVRSLLPVTGELIAWKLNLGVFESVADFGKIIPFISTLSEEASKQFKRIQGYLTLTIAWVFPFEVLAKFSRANTYALSYVTHSSRGGVMWNLGVALFMYSATSDGLSLALRLLHGLCHFYGYEDCEKKQRNYRTVAKLYYSMKVFWTLASGLLLAFTGGLSGGVAALFVLLFRDIASDIWMIVGNPQGFLNVYCLESDDADTKAIKDKYDVKKHVEEKLKEYDSKSLEAYESYVPPTPDVAPETKPSGEVFLTEMGKCGDLPKKERNACFQRNR